MAKSITILLLVVATLLVATQASKLKQSMIGSCKFTLVDDDLVFKDDIVRSIGVDDGIDKNPRCFEFWDFDDDLNEDISEVKLEGDCQKCYAQLYDKPNFDGLRSTAKITQKTSISVRSAKLCCGQKPGQTPSRKI